MDPKSRLAQVRASIAGLDRELANALMERGLPKEITNAMSKCLPMF